MPKVFGTPATVRIKSRKDFDTAVRSNDQKMLFGYGDEDDLPSIGMGYVDVIGGVQTNRFQGYSDYLAAGTGKVWASARAIDAISNVVISTETKFIFRDPAANKGKAKPKPDAKLIALMQNPNPHDTISELLTLWVAHMKFTGNVFWLKDQMNGHGQPKEIYCLNPRFIRILPDKQLRVAKYMYRVNGHEIEFDPEEIIHFRKPHANDPVWGLGDIQSGESLFDDHINRTLYNTRLMANGAMPSSVLVNEMYDGSQDDWERMQKGFNEKYAGVRNSGKVAWMNGKWSKLQLGLDSSAMQELEKSAKNVSDIFLHHGVPLSVVGYGSSNYATARVEDIQFRRYTCLPLLNLFTDTMNSPRGFVSDFNKELKLDFSLSGLIDIEQVVKENTPLLQNAVITPNEFRVLVGMQKSDNPLLDQFYMTTSLVPIEVAGMASPTDAQYGQPLPQIPPSGPDPVDPEKPGAKPKPAKKPDTSKPPTEEVNTADGGEEGAPAEPPKRTVRVAA